MRGVAFALGIVAIIVVALFLWQSLDPVQVERRADAAFYERQQARIELEHAELALAEQRQAAEQRAQWVAVWQATLHTTSIVTICGLVVFGVATGTMVLWHYYKRQQLVLIGDQLFAFKDVAGGLTREMSAHLLIMQRHADTLRAIHQPGQTPQSFSYSPSIEIGPRLPSTTPALPVANAAPPGLPDVALLSDVLPSLPLGRLAYGILSDGQLLTLPIAGSYHILYHGDTRSGKTNAIHAMIVQLHHKAQRLPLRIVLGDYKRELRATWGRSSLVERIEAEPASIAEAICELVQGNDGILDRYTRFAEASDDTGRVIRNLGEFQAATGKRLPLVFMVIDELNAVLQACDRSEKQALNASLTQALQMGAGAGIFILGGAQYLSSDVFKREGSRQFVTRAHFGSYDPTAIGMLFGARKLPSEVVELLGQRQGRGLIRSANQAQPIPFQALLCEESDIAEAIALSSESGIAGSAQEVVGSEIKHSSTSPDLDESEEGRKTTSTASNALPGTSSPSVSIDPEKYYGARYLLMKGWTKTAILKEIWACDGGRAYRQASREYEEIIAMIAAQESDRD